MIGGPEHAPWGRDCLELVLIVVASIDLDCVLKGVVFFVDGTTDAVNPQTNIIPAQG